MEACRGAHHLARELTALGHDVLLMAPQFVKPLVKSNKNNYLDAEAIAEAVQRPTMRFVPVKSVEQLDLQALHRVRERLVSRRTAVINQICAFLLERGVVFRTGRQYMAREMPMLFIHGARSASMHMKRGRGLGPWLDQLETRTHKNVAIVALANCSPSQFARRRTNLRSGAIDPLLHDLVSLRPIMGGAGTLAGQSLNAFGAIVALP